MRYFNTLSLPAIILALTISTAVDADLSFFAFSFSSLFKSADCVVVGEVTGVKNSESAMHMTFDVKETLMGNAAGTITVSSPLYNGAFLEDQAYLSSGTSYILFLSNANGWTIVNGSAGVLRGDDVADVRIVTAAFSGTPDLFTSERKTAQKNLFESLTTKAMKHRLLEGMRGQFDASDVSFLRSLIQSGVPDYQSFAAIQAGLEQIETMRTVIENTCRQTRNPSVKASCYFALAQYGNPESLPLVVSSLDDPVQYVKSSAVFAAGAIGTDDIASPLMNRYEKTGDTVEKMEIISALNGLKNSTLAKQCFLSLKESEANEKLLSMIHNRIAAIERR